MMTRAAEVMACRQIVMFAVLCLLLNIGGPVVGAMAGNITYGADFHYILNDVITVK